MYILIVVNNKSKTFVIYTPSSHTVTLALNLSHVSGQPEAEKCSCLQLQTWLTRVCATTVKQQAVKPKQ